jgi:hypothetical protein
VSIEVANQTEAQDELGLGVRLPLWPNPGRPSGDLEDPVDDLLLIQPVRGPVKTANVGVASSVASALDGVQHVFCQNVDLEHVVLDDLDGRPQEGVRARRPVARSTRAARRADPSQAR